MLRLGKSAKGKVIHIIINKNNQALCEKKQISLIVDSKLKLSDVTCKKCLQSSTFKKALAATPTKQSAKPDTPTSPPNTTIGIPELKTKPKITDPAFHKNKSTSGDFKIIHTATGKVFFNRVPNRVVNKAIKNLNKLDITWTSIDAALPKDFIYQCRTALAKAYAKAKISIPNDLKPQNNKDEEKQRTITRRDTKGKKTKETNIKTPFKFIINEMKSGIALSSLASKLETTFKLKPKKAAGRIKGSIRKMRKTGVVIIATMASNKNDDFYKIQEID